MPLEPQGRLTLLALAELAGVPPRVAYQARDRGVFSIGDTSARDVLPLLTYEALRRVHWPGESFARNRAYTCRPWELVAVRAVRIGVFSVPESIGLYVYPTGAELVDQLDRPDDVVRRLARQGSPFLSLPVGSWARGARHRAEVGGVRLNRSAQAP